MDASLSLARGECVRVRSEDEILATLDERGEIDGLPFMPEMLPFCGREFVVDARADKTCDTISGSLSARGMQDTVHLAGSRCDGAAHAGCQADCLIFWKEAWLERTESARVHPLWRFVADGTSGAAASDSSKREAGTVCDRAVLERNTLRSSANDGRPAEYRCQATELLDASTPLSPRALRPYLRDWLSGNVRPGYLLGIGLLRLVRRFVLFGPGVRVKMRLYDALAGLMGEPAWPYESGRLSGRTPTEQLDLQPGEWVTVKSHEEILDTLNDRSNRGMSFTAEMVRYCGRTFRVRARVERILDEQTGALVRLKNDCIILEDVVCRSECSTGRLFCPRAIYPYWREIWLRRAAPPPGASDSAS